MGYSLGWGQSDEGQWDWPAGGSEGGGRGDEIRKTTVTNLMSQTNEVIKIKIGTLWLYIIHVKLKNQFLLLLGWKNKQSLA